MKCECCNIIHNGSYGSGRFCTVKCARSFSSSINRKETTKKMQETFKKKRFKSLPRKCPSCLNLFTPLINKNQIFCCRNCAVKDNHKKMSRAAGLKSAEIQSESRRSLNEIFFSELCKQHFEVLENIRMFEGWDADVIIPELKIAILWNGPWHYRKITVKHSVLQVQTRDRLKCEAIERCGYQVYIIEDNGKHDKKFVEEQFKVFMLRYSGMAPRVGS